MVAIKSIIVLTLSALVVATPIASNKSGNQNDGEGRSRDDETVAKIQKIQASRCGNDQKISCCNSKGGTGGLLGLDLGMQCTSILDGLTAGLIPISVLNGDKSSKCDGGSVRCCNHDEKDDHSNSGFQLIGHADINVLSGQCQNTDLSKLL